MRIFFSLMSKFNYKMFDFIFKKLVFVVVFVKTKLALHNSILVFNMCSNSSKIETIPISRKMLESDTFRLF